MFRVKPFVAGLLLVTSVAVVTNSANAVTSAPKPIAGGYSLLTDDAVVDDYAVKMGNLLFYVGSDSEHGTELWRTDGTARGTKMVVDATPGRASTNFGGLFVAGGKVWFTTWRGGIWATTGTSAGTKKVSDTLTLEQAVDHPTEAGSAILVATPSDSGNSELYKSSGTAASTSLVGGAEIIPGPDGSSPRNFLKLGGYQYFLAFDGVLHQLMRTDGASFEVVDPLNQPTFGYWSKPLKVNNELVIIDDTGVVWTWDNTAFHLEATWSNPGDPYEADGSMYASVLQLDQYQLYRFDSTGVTNLSFVVGEPIQIIRGFTVVSGSKEYFFFTTFDSSSETSLWYINESGSLPQKLTTFPFPPYDFVVNGIEVAANGRVYLSATIWYMGLVNYWVPIVGGEARRVAPRADDRPDKDFGIPLHLVRGSLVSSYNDPINGVVPIRIAPVGNSPITVLARNPMPRMASHSAYGAFSHAVAGDTLYFTAYDQRHGIELWKYEKGASSAVLVKDILPGVGSSRPNDLLAVNGKVYFNAWTEELGYEPWVSDGTASGTRMIMEAYSDDTEFAAVGKVVFMTFSDESGNEVLYRTDGTPGGLRAIASSPFGLQYDDIDFIGVHLGALYFKGRLSESGGIFKVTPTMTRTQQVLSLGDEYPDVDEIELVGNKFIFLWETDSTVGFFAVQKSFGPRPVNLGVRNIDEGEFLGVVNGRLIFVVETDADNSPEILWQTNGERSGTSLLKDIDPASETYDDSEPLNLVVGGKLLFYGETTRGGTELWSTDGTPAGTKTLLEIGRGAKSGLEFYSNIVASGKYAYFDAPDSSGAIVLWRTNGTASGTSAVTSAVTQVRVVEAFSNSLVIAAVKGDNSARLYLQSFAA